MAPRLFNPQAKEALLDAARVEFARSGFVRARVEDICRRAGVSKGAFYLHFDTKEGVFKEMLQRFLGVLEEHARRFQEVSEQFAQTEGPLTLEDITTRSDRFRRARELDRMCDRELLDLFWRNRQILAALDGASGKWYRQLLHDFRRRMIAIVVQGVGGGGCALYQGVDPDFVADVAVGSYEAFIRRMLTMSTKPDLDRWSSSFASLFYEGIRGVLSSGTPRASRSLASSNKNDRPVKKQGLR